VEYNVGLGGVTVQLVECRDDDPSTANNEEEEATQVVTAVTIGVNVQGRPNLIISGGNYNLVNIKVDRSYYINVKAPTGYLLTGGVCNDDDEFGDWRKCDGGGMLEGLSYYDGEGSTRRDLQQPGQDDATKQQQQQQQLELWQHSETKLGIPEGRSSKCVSVDQDGLVDSTLDIGVMRLGDTNTFVVGYNVILDRDDDDNDTTTTAVITAPMTMTRRRRMRRNLEEDKEQPTSPILLPKDLDAIRNVVTEIFAVNLQKTLVQNNLSFVQIDEVFSVDVQYYPVNAITAIDDEDGANNLFGDNTKSDDETTDSMVGTTKKLFQNAQSRSGGNEEVDFFTNYSLSVDLIVKGHYRKDMDVNNGGGDVTNATTIVNLIQDVTSGNTTQDEALFQDLLGYNTMCLEQMTKMKEPGFTLDDYSEVHSSKGILRLSSPSRDFFKSEPTVFSVACASGNVLGFLLNEEKTEEEVEVVTTTKVEEGQGALDKVSTASAEDTGSPWMLIIIALVFVFVGIGLVVFLVRRRSAKEKDRRASDASSGSTTPSLDEKEKGDAMGTLLGLFYKKRVVSENAEFHDIEAGVESGSKFDDDKPSTTAAVSGIAAEEIDKEHFSQQKSHSGVDEGNMMDQLDEEAVNTETDRTEEDKADAPNLEPHAVSLNFDSSDSKRSRRSRKSSRKKSNSDFANEPSQSKRHNPLSRSICDLDIGTKRMKDKELSALILEEIVTDHEKEKKIGHGNRGHRRRGTADKSDNDKSNERRKRRVHENHQDTAKYTSAASSRRRGRKHDPLRQSIDDSNIGLRSRGTISTLNDAPKGSRRKSRKPDPLRMSQDDSNIGLRTAGDAAANNDAKKTSRRKGRKHDPLRMSQDDSNVGLRTARAKASKNDSGARRRKGRRQDPLRRSRCDLDIGTKRQPENTLALKDRSSKSERHKHDRRTNDEKERRPSAKRSSSK